MSSQGDNYRYRCLDAWRGIAALSIVMYHAGSYAVCRQTALSSFEYIFSKIIQHLDIGVLLFFVISGYCISASTEVFRKKEKVSVFRFLLRRFSRIYPTYWMAPIFALMVGSSGVYLNWGLESNFAKPLTLSVSQWFGNILLIETWLPLFTKRSEVLLLLPSWFLCYQVQFYVLMGLMLVFRFKLLHWTLVISGVTLITMFFPQLIGLSSVYRLFLDGHWLFFGTGILVFYALHFQQKKLLWSKLCFWSLALLLIIFGAMNGSDIALYFAISTLFGVVLLTMFSDDKIIFSAWPVKPFTFCGKISYSLYLIHLPVCCVLAPKFFSWGFTSIIQTMLITIPICIGVSVVFAIFFYRYCEKPFIAKY
jgi:peptidoglycan/LPS O-acetylase OafA/YrhL